MRVDAAFPVLLGYSILIIGGALFFQYAVGLVPCELCLAERWPWYAAIALIALLLILRQPMLLRWAPIVLALIFLGSTAFGLYHVGVEQHIIPGPDACTAPAIKAQSIDDLLKQIQAAPVVRCDEPQWTLFGISLAGWNAAASALALILAVRAVRRTMAS